MGSNSQPNMARMSFIATSITYHPELILGAIICESGMMLVVVGPEWLSAGALENPNDPIRIEMELAFARGLQVIPILIGNAKMPRQEDLPESIREFAFRNALQIDPGVNFDHQVGRLIETIDHYFKMDAFASSLP